MKKRAPMLPLPQVSTLMTQWYGKSAGRVLLDESHNTISPWLQKVFGHYALNIRSFQIEDDWLTAAGVRSHFTISAARQDDSLAVGDFSMLPFDTESLDLVIAHHVFEFVENPHELLREIDRVLIPEGRLIVIAFNPFGIYGALKPFKLGAVPPWAGRFYSALRLKDWLLVLGFRVEEVRSVAFPFASRRNSASRLHRVPALCERFLPFSGALFALSAVKQVSRLISVGESWPAGGDFFKRKVVPTAFTPKGARAA